MTQKGATNMIDYIPIILQAAGMIAGFAWLMLITIETVRREKDDE